MFKSNVSQELREQIVNIIDDLVDEIAPGYLPPNSIFPLNYREAIYEEVYKYLKMSITVMKYLIFYEKSPQRNFLMSPNTY